jgi:folate-binding protein YgfZ
MTQTKVARLHDRSIVRVAGEDAGKLLQGIVTNDMELLAGQPAIHTALLTPQGKILFEFFLVKATDGFLLDTCRGQADGLVKRLMMYKLRARVSIDGPSLQDQVLAQWRGPQRHAGKVGESVSFPDPRLVQLGWRSIVDAAAGAVPDAAAEDYHAHRIALGVPEGGKDYALGDTFPHEANLDVLGGVSFTKGCFVGQEVVSRMQHRGSVRKRIVIVEGDGPLQSGSDIMAGAAAIGTIGSTAGRQALALLRLDRAREAIDKGEPLTAAGARIAMRLPDYLKSVRAAAAS